MLLSPLVLKPQADRRLRRGHLWIYSNEVNTEKTPLKSFQAGEQVEVLNNKGQSMGVAFINPNTLICGRLISRDVKYPLSKSLLVHRIKRALALREMCFDKPFYRLIYGDSDLLPGLVVDRFGDYLVVQIATAGMEAEKTAIVEALQQCLQPKAMLLRNDHSARSLEGLPEEVESIGDFPEAVEVWENDTQFSVPVADGQKTGWFYDHRSNRAELQRYVKGKRVLDVFSYIGGWGVEAAKAGASEVVCVDASRQALEWVDRNAALNDVGAQVKTLQGKAVNIMKKLIDDGEKFDVVVLDPPAFIKRRKDQKAGEAAYRHINELGIRLLGREGLLVSASCSMHLAKETLVDIIRGSGRHLDRHVQIIGQGGQGPDHPIHPAIVETDYLKAVFSRVFHI